MRLRSSLRYALTLVGIAATAAADAPTATLPAPAAQIAEAVGLRSAGLEPQDLALLIARRVHAPWGERGRGVAVHQRLAALCTSGPPGEPIPTLLEADQWAALLDRAVPRATLGCTLLTDSRAALVYHGLAGLSDAAREVLARDRESLRAIARSSAPAFAAFGPALEVIEGRVVVPGGDAARGLWETLLEARADQPARFARALLGRAGGRAAFLYATLAAMEPVARAWALGLDETDLDKRRQRFEELAAAFAADEAWWDPGRAPLSRRRVDAASVLTAVRLGPDGKLAAPATRGFWQAAFAGAGEPGRDTTAVDAAWLVREIGQAALEDQAVRRLGQLQFGQRLLAAGAAVDADALAAVRSAGDRPALALGLELLVASPALHAAARRRTTELAALPREAAASALVQFQAALALLLEARRNGLLDADAARDIATAVVGLEVRREGYGGQLAAVLDERLLPALAAATYGSVEPGDADTVVARGLTGVRPSSGPSPTFRFEGLTFSADVAGARARRLLAFAAAQMTPPLAAALDFSRASRRFQGAEDAATLDALRAAARALPSFVPPAATERVDPARRVAEALEALRRGGTSRAALAARLLAASDAAVADALAGLLYALHASPLQERAPESLARRHELGLGLSGADERAAFAFALPHAVSGAGRPWRIEGSLLGLESGFARVALRRASPDPPAEAPSLGDAERQSLGMWVGQMAAMAPGAVPDPALVRAAFERGRAALRERPAAVAALGLGAWRDARLRAARGAGADVEPLLGLAELAALGGVAWPAGFGASRLLSEHTLTLSPPQPTAAWESFGRRDGRLAERSLDLPLRLLLSLDARGLPAELLPALFPYAAQDAFEHVRLLHAGDELALGRFARELEEHRVDDYLAALAGEGSLQEAGGL